MNVTTEETQDRQLVIDIIADREQVDRSLDASYRRLASQVNVPGFRRGKAPREILQTLVGREVVLDDALEHLAPQLLRDAVAEREDEAIGQPVIEVKERDPATFHITVPLRPVVELGDYRGLRVEDEPVEIAPDATDAALERLRAVHATWEPREGAVEVTNMVTLDLKGTVEEETILDQEGLQFHVIPGGTNPMPGFPEALLSISKGETKEFDLPFPDDYPDSRLTGKVCHWRATVKEVKAERLPELDDGFAHTVGQGHETLGELRSSLEEELRTRTEGEAKVRFQERVIDRLVEEATLRFPPQLVEVEIDNLLRDRMRRLNTVSVEDYVARRGMEVEALRDEVRPEATLTVRRSLVLSRIAEEEGLTIEDEAVEAEIDTLTAASGEQAEQLRELLSRAEVRDSIRRRLLSQGSLDVIASFARGEAPERLAATDSLIPGGGMPAEGAGATDATGSAPV